MIKRGQIYYVNLDPTMGREQQGLRPVMVVSHDSFNRFMPAVVLPITSGGDFARTKGFAVPLTGSGLATTGVVRCDQPRTIDLSARQATLKEQAPEHIVDEVLAKLLTLFY